MILNTIFKNIFFISHILFIILSFIAVFFYWQILIVNFITILSWYFNNNVCLLTQIEKYLFNQTIIDVFIKNTNRYVIPFKKRLLLYIFFLFGFIYHFLGELRASR
jgi:hypothetical protein